MDKRATFGFVLIALVLMVWMWFNTPPPQTGKPRPDSAATSIAVQPESAKAKPPLERPVEAEHKEKEQGLGQFFSSRAKGAEKILVVETDLYRAEITTKGGLIRKWELKNFKTWNQFPVQLVDPEKGGDFSLLFISKDGKQINTRNLYFNAAFSSGVTTTLAGEESLSVNLELPVGEGKKIVKRLTFTNNKYSFDAEVLFVGMQDVVSGFEYQVVWENTLPYAEHNSIDESGFARAYAYSGGELAEIDATSETEQVKKDITGVTDWVAMRNKYFALAIMPTSAQSQGGYLEGSRKAQPDRGEKESYNLALKMPFKAQREERSRFTVFLGPLDFSLIKSMDKGLDHIMSLGAAWIIRPITEYLMLPLF
ncbi:MAG: membrane protein insertase YidC, partial [Ignavibacteriae bacterium]|nr:membrane protein insertase YidC [Ignavibacteriota bacterium]